MAGGDNAILLHVPTGSRAFCLQGLGRRSQPLDALKKKQGDLRAEASAGVVTVTPTFLTLVFRMRKRRSV